MPSSPMRKKETSKKKTLRNAETKAALDRTTKSILRLQRNASRNFWAVGRRLLRVSELGLHRARGFASIEQYVETRLAMSATAAYQYMRIAGAFPEDIAVTFGPEKLDRALAYIAATPEKEEPPDKIGSAHVGT